MAFRLRPKTAVDNHNDNVNNAKGTAKLSIAGLRKFSSATRCERFGGRGMMISAELADEIDIYLKHLCVKFQLPSNFLEGHPGRIDGRMRAILVDWLMQVVRRFTLRSETFSLTVWLLDRSLTKIEDVDKRNLQLLGVTCLFVASKYEEVDVPNINDFVFISADTFRADDIYRMEFKLLHAVDYNCNIPHSIEFLRRFRYYLAAPTPVYNMSKFICEVGTLTYSLAHYTPNETAAAALFLAAFIHSFSIKIKNYCEMVNMSSEEVVKIARNFVPHVIEYTQPEPKLLALRDLYNTKGEMALDKEKMVLLRKFSHPPDS